MPSLTPRKPRSRRLRKTPSRKRLGFTGPTGKSYVSLTKLADMMKSSREDVLAFMSFRRAHRRIDYRAA